MLILSLTKTKSKEGNFSFNSSLIFSILPILENLDSKFILVPSEFCDIEISSQSSELFVTISITSFKLLESNFFFKNKRSLVKKKEDFIRNKF